MATRAPDLPRHQVRWRQNSPGFWMATGCFSRANTPSPPPFSHASPRCKNLRNGNRRLGHSPLPWGATSNHPD
ncbi:hypothetical protein [Adhaeribacter pallidiroseus]|uniref:hypothetical protein n=1 Tax=Adhaeribacter pallidiroseus TaxID=2072847 RepID=UPI0011C02F95|nr:hypothetical protein [Adhaeribacter pallidiroseus]